MRISDGSSDVCSPDLINRVTLGDIVTSERHRLLTACRDDLATETVDVDHPFEALAFRLNDRRDRCWSHTRRALRCQTHDDRGGERHYRRSEEHTSELQSLMRISYAVFCLKKKKHRIRIIPNTD